MSQTAKFRQNESDIRTPFFEQHKYVKIKN